MKTITPSTLHEALEKPLRGEFMKFSRRPIYNTTTTADDTGSQLHAYAEAVLKLKMKTYYSHEFYQLKKTVKDNENNDEDTKIYINKVLSVFNNLKSTMNVIETEWNTGPIEDIHPDLKGFCDCFIYDGYFNTLYVFDLKTGSESKISPDHNEQLISYSSAILNFLEMQGYEVEKIYNYINDKPYIYTREEMQEAIDDLRERVTFLTNKPIETTLLRAVQELMVTEDTITRARIISDLTRDLTTTKASIKEEIMARIRDGEDPEGFQIITTEPNGLNENNEKSFQLLKGYYDDSEFKRKLPTIKEMRERGVPESIIKQMPRKEGSDKLYRIKRKEKWEI